MGRDVGRRSRKRRAAQRRAKSTARRLRHQTMLQDTPERKPADCAPGEVKSASRFEAPSPPQLQATFPSPIEVSCVAFEFG